MRVIKSHYLYLMNHLPESKRIEIIKLLVAGNTLQHVAAYADVSANTAIKLLSEIGSQAARYHDQVMRKTIIKSVHCVVVSSPVRGRRGKAGKEAGPMDPAGHVTWIAFEPRSKLVLSYMVGTPTRRVAEHFVHDISNRCTGEVELLLKGRSISISSDREFDAEVLAEDFTDADFDECYGFVGYSDFSSATTSIERTHTRKLQRLHESMSLHIVYHNFVALKEGSDETPAVQVDLASRCWSIDELITLPSI